MLRLRGEAHPGRRRKCLAQLMGFNDIIDGIHIGWARPLIDPSSSRNPKFFSTDGTAIFSTASESANGGHT